MPPARRHYHWVFETTEPILKVEKLKEKLQAVALRGAVHVLEDGRVKGYVSFKNHRYIPHKRPWWLEKTDWSPAENAVAAVAHLKSTQVDPFEFGEEEAPMIKAPLPESVPQISICQMQEEYFKSLEKDEDLGAQPEAASMPSASVGMTARVAAESHVQEYQVPSLPIYTNTAPPGSAEVLTMERIRELRALKKTAESEKKVEETDWAAINFKRKSF